MRVPFVDMVSLWASQSSIDVVGKAGSHPQTGKRLYQVPPFGGRDNGNPDSLKLRSLAENSRPVSCAEAVAAVDHGVNEQYTILHVRQVVKSCRRQETNTEPLSIKKAWEVVLNLKKPHPVLPDLQEPVAETVLLAGIVCVRDLVVGEG
jgi:hypothetical protein